MAALRLLGIYRAAHARNMIVMNHNHSLFNPIAHNFSDYWYPGEQYESGMVQNPAHFYCEGISLEAYQSELSARIKGVGMIFLPQTLRAVELNKSLRDKGRFDGEIDARRAMTPLLLHDIPVLANWLNFKPVEAFWRLGDEVNLDAARFTGYWEDGAVAVTGAVGVKASRYTWPAGARYRALIVVANLGREPARFDLRLDRAALGLPAGPLLVEEALEQNQKWSLEDRLSNLSLPGNDYLLLGIRTP